jgi:hypothetical protein
MIDYSQPNASEMRRCMRRAQPYVRLTLGEAQTLTNGANTAIAWKSEPTLGGEDKWGMHESVTNPSRVNILVAGRYLFFVSVQWEANATGARVLSLIITPPSGATPTIARDNLFPTGAPTTGQVMSGSYDCVAGSYVEVYALQSSGGDLDLEAATDNASFHVARLS